MPLTHVHLSIQSQVSTGKFDESQGLGHATGIVGGMNLVVVSVGG